MRAKGRSNDWIILSTYLDGEMTAREKEKLEQRLRASPQLKKRLEELRSTRAMIRSLPRKKAPRNFVLTPEMVRERKKSGWLPALGLTSAASALIVILLLFIQFGPGLLSGGMPSSEPQQEVAMYSQDSTETFAEEAPVEGAKPEIVYWGGPPPLVFAEGKGGGAPEILMQPAPPGTGGEQPLPEAVREPPVEEQEQPAEEAAPPVELQAVPEGEESLEAPQVKIDDEDFNPILGVSPSDEAVPLMRFPDDAPVEEPVAVEKVSTVLIILLGGLSVATGLSAYILWRRMR